MFESAVSDMGFSITEPSAELVEEVKLRQKQLVDSVFGEGYVDHAADILVGDAEQKRWAESAKRACQRREVEELTESP